MRAAQTKAEMSKKTAAVCRCFFVFYLLTNDFQVYILNIYNIVERDYAQISFRRG